MQILIKVSEDEDIIVPVEPRNTASSPRYIVHWVTHARKRGVGMWAWILHRVTAVIILLSAIIHVSRNQFGVITPGGRLVSIDLLVFALTYHSLNGVRILLIESSELAARNEDKLFWGVIVLSLLFISTWILVVGL